MRLKEFAEKHQLTYVPETLYNVVTGAPVESGYVYGRHIELERVSFATSFIERLSPNDECLALQYRGPDSVFHKDFDPNNEEETREALKAVFG